MVSETTPVNDEGKDLATFGGRLIAERNRLRFKQVDVCLFGGVSKTTQIKYESNERRPDSDYLERLERKGFDVLYLLTGTRSTESLTPELQNLVDAYQDAPLLLREAAFAVLLSPTLRRVRLSREVPGYARYELKGENDVRYQEWADAYREAEKENLERTRIDGTVGQLVEGDATFNGRVDIAGGKNVDPKKKR